MTELLTPGGTGPNGETWVSRPAVDSTNGPNAALELDSVAHATIAVNETGVSQGLITEGREWGFPGSDQVVTLLRPLSDLTPETSDRVPRVPSLPVRHSGASRNPYAVYVASLAPGEAQRAMTGCLNRIAKLFADRAGLTLDDPPGLHFPWAALRYEHTAGIRALLAAKTRDDGMPWSPSYLNKHLAALRSVLEHAWKLELMSAEDYHRACAVDNFKGTRLPAGRSVAGAERNALVDAALAEGTMVGLRDAALIETLYATGCRRSELAAARTRDYAPGDRTIKIIGKRNKQRLVHLTEYAAHLVGRWLAAAGPGEFLFRAFDRWDQVLPRGMTGGAIGKMLVRRGKRTELPPLSPHDMRRTFIGDLLDEGVDLVTVQQLVGHASPATTARYDRRPERARKAAVDKLNRKAAT